MVTQAKTATLSNIAKAGEESKLRWNAITGCTSRNYDPRKTNYVLAPLVAIRDYVKHHNIGYSTALKIATTATMTTMGYSEFLDVLKSIAPAAIELKSRCDVFKYVVRQELLRALDEELIFASNNIEKAARRDKDFDKAAQYKFVKEDLDLHRGFLYKLYMLADEVKKQSKKATRSRVTAPRLLRENLAFDENFNNATKLLHKLKDKHEVDKYFEKTNEKLLKQSDFITNAANVVLKGIPIEMVRIAVLSAQMPNTLTLQNQNCLLKVELGLYKFPNVNDAGRKDLLKRFGSFSIDFFHFLEYLYDNECQDFNTDEIRDAYIDIFNTTYEEYKVPQSQGRASQLTDEEHIQIDRVRKKIKQILEESLFQSKTTVFNPSESRLLRDVYEEKTAIYTGILQIRAKSYIRHFGQDLSQETKDRVLQQFFNRYTTFDPSSFKVTNDQDLRKLFDDAVSKIQSERQLKSSSYLMYHI